MNLEDLGRFLSRKEHFNATRTPGQPAPFTLSADVLNLTSQPAKRPKSEIVPCCCSLERRLIFEFNAIALVS